MTRTDWVYLNGDFLKAEDASVSPFDRGFLFAHAAYEVTAVFEGRFVDLDAHLDRLAETLTGIEIPPLDLDLAALHEGLRQRNDLQEGLIYLHVTAGHPGPRDFYGPEVFEPTVFMCATHRSLIGDAARTGLTAITAPDTRWAHRNLKTTQLLSQSLAYRAARRAGADTAVMHENGLVTEAASANLWMVTADGVLVTRDLSAALLPGITRRRLFSLLAQDVGAIEERAFTLAELRGAAEAFTTSTGMVIAPVLRLDEEAIGTGAPGPVTRRVQAAYYAFLGADIRAYDWL